MSKKALVVSGGGSKGAFAVGAVKYLNEKGFSFDVVSGTSTGALIVPMVAINDIDVLEKIYTSITTKEIVRHNWRKLYWNAILDTKPLERLIKKFIGLEGRYEAVMASPVTILLCAVDLQTQDITYFTQRKNIPNTVCWENVEEFVLATLASTNQPVFTPAVKIKGHQYVDGGIREIIPVRAAIESGCDKIVVISNSPEKPGASDKELKNIASIGMRTLGIMGTEIATNDVKQFLEYNKLIKYLDGVMAKAATIPGIKMDEVFAGRENFNKHIDITVIRPEKNLGMDGLTFDPEKMTEALHKGYDRAKKVLNI